MLDDLVTVDLGRSPRRATSTLVASWASTSGSHRGSSFGPQAAVCELGSAPGVLVCGMGAGGTGVSTGAGPVSFYEGLGSGSRRGASASLTAYEELRGSPDSAGWQPGPTSGPLRASQVAG
jgi:hypothetical protein